MKLFSKLLFAFVLMIVTSASWTGGSQTIEQWGATHYQNFGRAEERNLPANGSYGDYVRNYPDLLAAYNASVASSAGGSNSGGSPVSSINYDQGFPSCSYTKPTLTCFGDRGSILISV